MGHCTIFAFKVRELTCPSFQEEISVLFSMSPKWDAERAHVHITYCWVTAFLPITLCLTGGLPSVCDWLDICMQHHYCCCQWGNPKLLDPNSGPLPRELLVSEEGWVRMGLSIASHYQTAYSDYPCPVLFFSSVISFCQAIPINHKLCLHTLCAGVAAK